MPSSFGRAVHLIDNASEGPSTKAIVYVDHCHAVRTAVQHRQECSDSSETRAVAYAGRNGNYWCRDQPTYHAGESAFHASYHDYDPSLLKC